GMLVHESVCGCVPGEVGTRPASSARALEGNPAPLSEACRTDLPTLDRIVATCLSKQPSGRYSSTYELVTDLERLRAETSTPSGHDGARVSTLRWWWEFH